jgi:hypothetical protein
MIGQILGRVDCGVDGAGEERGVDFLCEQAFAADIGERTILDPIARRPNDLKPDPPDLPTMRLSQPTTRLVRLRAPKARVPSVNRAGRLMGAA